MISLNIEIVVELGTARTVSTESVKWLKQEVSVLSFGWKRRIVGTKLQIPIMTTSIPSDESPFFSMTQCNDAPISTSPSLLFLPSLQF